MDSESDMGDPQAPFIMTDSDDEYPANPFCENLENIPNNIYERTNSIDSIDSIDDFNDDLEKFIDGMANEVDNAYSAVTLRLAKPCYEEARPDICCPSGCDISYKTATRWVKNKCQCKICGIEWIKTREGAVLTKDMQIYSLTLKLKKSLCEIESLKHILKLQRRRDCYVHTKRDMWIEPLD